MSSPAVKRQRLSLSTTALQGRSSLRQSRSGAPTAPASGSVIASDLVADVDNEHTRSQLRRSVVPQPSASKLAITTQDGNVRARLNTLEYEVRNLQQERDMLVLQHQKELSDAQAKAEADFKKHQASESACAKANQRYDAVRKQLRDMEETNTREKEALERQIRQLQTDNAVLREDSEDMRARLTDQERGYSHSLADADAKRAALQEAVDQLKRELEHMSQSVDASQALVAQKDAEAEDLQAQILHLKSHPGDSKALNVLQTQLSDQLSHIRELETSNRQQVAELRKLRDTHRNVQVIEEQKRGLETELGILKDVERQLGEAQIQREILEDEKKQWTSLLERDGQESEFDSPEAVVKALVQTRIELASLTDRLGIVESELVEKDEAIKSLDANRSSLQRQLEAATSAQQSTASEAVGSRAYKRLERQKNLAVKEVEYLKAQLQTFDSEETALIENRTFDSQRADQIKQLEEMLAQYKAEIATLHSELSKQDAVVPEGRQTRGMKRRAESQEPEEDSSQLGHQLRKNKNLQIALQKTAQQSQMLATELQAAKSQLKLLRQQSKTRILELRDNPTANAEAIKLSTLRILREENASLLAQLRGEELRGIKTVPVSTVDHLKLDLQDMEKVVAEKEKRMRRQREIWADKAAEFRDVIASVLGWRVNFLPNGKAKVSSGTMKISGGAGGAFEAEIKEQVDFWVKERKEIPCFLAALTFQFHEEYSRVSSPASIAMFSEADAIVGQAMQHRHPAARCHSESPQSPSNSSSSSTSTAIVKPPGYGVITLDDPPGLLASSHNYFSQSTDYARDDEAANARLKTAQQTADDLISFATPTPDPIPSRRPTPPSTALVPLGTSPYDITQLANNPIDPFRKSSITLDQTAHSLLEYYRSVYHPAVWHVETKATQQGDYGFQTSATDVIQSALQSDVDMYALLACMSSRRHYVDGQPGSYETDEYLGKALAATRRFMKDRASQEPKSNEEILMVIFHLYATEGYRNNVAAAKVHMRGARTIIDMLGGLQNLRDPQMRELLIIGDGLLSAMTLAPCMLPCEFDPGSYLEATPPELYLNPTYDLRGIAPAFKEGANVQLIPLAIQRLIDETADISWVLTNANDGSPEASRHALRWIQIRSMAVRHKLLGLSLSDQLYNALRATLVLWIVTSTTLLGKVKLRFLIAPQVRAILRSASHQRRDWDGHLDIKAWILTLGSICCFPGSPDQDWFVHKLYEFLVSSAPFEPSSLFNEDVVFHQLEHLMGRFFYHEPVFGGGLRGLARELVTHATHNMTVVRG
ncbi:hypothetical protein DV735_g3592, partial [Chaetothyriales sp. CBS 134920]